MNRFLAVAVAILLVSLALSQQPLSETTGIALGGGSSASCPVMVIGLLRDSPAEKAGLDSGDVLLSVNGVHVSSVDEAAKLLHSKSGTPLVLELMHAEKTYQATVGKERLSVLLEKSGSKLLSTGMIAPVDATETEMKGKMESLLARERMVDRVFPTHYPADQKLYYAGFEVLILKNPQQVVVLGIEDGPASSAGVHWGDTIVEVNGIDPRNKSVAELERLFSSEKPAMMTLKIERGGQTRTYAFALAQAAQVMRDNNTQIVNGNPLPLGTPEKYLHCFLE